MYLPQPDNSTGVSPDFGKSLVGRAIGLMSSVKMMFWAVRKRDTSLSNRRESKFSCRIILSNLTKTPPDKRWNEPITAYTNLGLEFSNRVQCPAVIRNRSCYDFIKKIQCIQRKQYFCANRIFLLTLKIEPPQKCCLFNVFRSDIW